MIRPGDAIGKGTQQPPTVEKKKIPSHETTMSKDLAKLMGLTCVTFSPALIGVAAALHKLTPTQIILGGVALQALQAGALLKIANQWN